MNARVQPLEQIETAFDNMFQEVNQAYISIIEYLNGLSTTFLDFHNNAQAIKVTIESANLHDVFSPSVQSISNFADNATNNIFFASIDIDGVKSIESSRKTYCSLMKTVKDTINSIFQKIRSTIHSLQQLNDQNCNQEACKEFHQTLLQFISQFQSFKNDALHAIQLGISHSHNAIKNIEDGAILSVSLLMGKFQIDSEIHQQDPELESIPILQKAISDYFNFEYLYQHYIIQKSLLDESNSIDFFELESANRKRKIRVVTNCPCTGYIKDGQVDSPDSQIDLPKGQEGELVNCNGYSEAWYIQFSSQPKCYVMIDKLNIIHE